MRDRSDWSIDQFAMARKLGGGYASTVHLAICKATGIQVAIKVYHRSKLSQLNHYQVRREIRIHSCLDHTNILRLYSAFEDDVGVYLVTEYASRGDVFGELDRRGGTMSEGDAVRQVLQPFVSALRYLHALDIIHRDIKPENLLMSASGELKVADFGLSIDVTRERPITRVGTLDYMAPEVVVCPDKCRPDDGRGAPQLHYTHLVDAWAVGVLAFELTVGRAPFDAGNKRATIDRILHGQPAFPAWIGEQARHFISWSLTKDAAARPDIRQLAYHPWITGHAPRLRPAAASLLSSSRARSVLDLHMLPGAAGAASESTAHMEARHKAMVAGHVGGAGLLPSSDSAEDDDELEAAAAGDDVIAPLGLSPPRRAGFASAFAAAAAAPLGEPARLRRLGGGGASGSVADSLRAYVHRCQSHNNLESLREAVLMQPPEPSNACFEPGGRFYSPKAGGAGRQQQRPAAAGDAVAPAPAAVAAAPAPVPAAAGMQQQQQQQQQGSGAQTSDARSSAGSGSSARATCGSTPPLPPSAPAAARPPPLQLVRLPSPTEGSILGAAAAPPAVSVAASSDGPAAMAAALCVPCEGGAAPRVHLFARAGAAAPAAAAPPLHSAPRAPSSRAASADTDGAGVTASAGAAGGGARSSSAASVPAPCRADSSGSDGSSCDGAPGDFGSVVSSSPSPSAREQHAQGAEGARCCSNGASAPLSPPEPMSPPHYHYQGAAVGAAIRAPPLAAAGAGAAMPAATAAAAGASGAAGEQDVGASQDGRAGQAGWFGLQCVNFLKSSMP